jgi:hypothetical protein|tara:strand:- start:51 stop:308 length:258 start_codon:yes stop_codon:yes gene_type:complete
MTTVVYDYQPNFFSGKDGLPSGDPLKLITGQQFENEFIKIDPAIKSRILSVSGSYSGGLSGDTLTLSGDISADTLTLPQLNGGTF